MSAYMSNLTPEDTTYQKLIAVIQQNSRDPNRRGIANDLQQFLSTGNLPVGQQAQQILLAALQGTPWANDPQKFFTAYNAHQSATTSTREDRSGITPGDGNPVLGSGLAGAANANAAAGGELSLAERVAAAASAASGGAGVDIGAGATPPPMSVAGANGGVVPPVAGGGAPTPGQIVHAPPVQPGGFSAADDNGIGGGGPAAAAAQAARTQQVQQSTPTGGTTTGPGGYTADQAEVLSKDDNQLIRFAMQQAGLNPDRVTKFSKIAVNALAPLLRARRAAFGIANGQNKGGLPDDIAQMAAAFTHGGGSNFYTQQQQYGQQVLDSDNYKNAVAGLGDAEQQYAMYQSLMPLTYAGSNPLIQQSAADSADRQYNAFNDQDFRTTQAGGIDPSGGIFTKFLQQQTNLDPITRRVFGLR